MHTPTPVRRSTRYGGKRTNGTRAITIAVSHVANGIQTDICTVASIDYADEIVRAVNAHEAMKKALALILDDYTHGNWCPDSDELIPTIRRAIAMAEGKEQP